MDLQQQIETYIRDLDASFGIHIKNIKTKEEIHIDSDRLFQMASVVKIPILVTLYEMVYQGTIDLNERIEIKETDLVPGSGVIKDMAPGIMPTIKDLATMMIIVSDNLATDKLLQIVGMENVRNKMHDLGLHHIFIEHTIWDLLRLSVDVSSSSYSEEAYNEIIHRLKMGEYNWDSIVFQDDPKNNVSTAKDMSLLLEKIALGEFVSEECSQDIIDILLKQRYQQRIPGALPRGVVAGNKTGSLGTMFNDAGIVYLPDSAFVMTVYSIGNTLDYRGNKPIAHIARMAYDYFSKSK